MSEQFYSTRICQVPNLITDVILEGCTIFSITIQLYPFKLTSLHKLGTFWYVSKPSLPKQ